MFFVWLVLGYFAGVGGFVGLLGLAEWSLENAEVPDFLFSPVHPLPSTRKAHGTGPPYNQNRDVS